MDNIVKRAPLKVLIKEYRKLLRGPLHIFLAISICIFTYCMFNYFKSCWVNIDAFCPTVEHSNLILKVTIALTQFFGIAFLLMDLDDRIHTLTGTKLKNYFINKITGWWSLFFIRSQHASSSATGSVHTGGTAICSVYETKATVEEQLEYLQRRIIEVETRIAKEGIERKELEKKVETDLKKIYSAIDQSEKQVMKTVTKLHVGGYTRQLWSLFFIAYSAVLGIFV